MQPKWAEQARSGNQSIEDDLCYSKGLRKEEEERETLRKDERRYKRRRRGGERREVVKVRDEGHANMRCS